VAPLPNLSVYFVGIVVFILLIISSPFKSENKLRQRIEKQVDKLYDMVEGKLFDHRLSIYDETLERKWTLYGFKILKVISKLLREKEDVRVLEELIPKAKEMFNKSRHQYLVAKVSGL